MNIERYSLSFIYSRDQVLLGQKLRGRGTGFFNGFGGKINTPYESVLDATIREIKEECGLTIRKELVSDFSLLNFINQDEEDKVISCCEVYVSKMNFDDLDPLEREWHNTEECSCKWFHHLLLPWESMWPYDKYWLPFVLNENMKINASFIDKEGVLNSMIIGASNV